MSARMPSPEFLPVLSRGKHRSPRHGACFMEYASVLAGERWSDRPSCTHPALAALARLVNDWSSDAERSHLAPMVPSVIGLAGNDPRTELLIALRAAAAAVPVASEGRQRMLAVGLLRCEDRLAQVDPHSVERIGSIVRSALDDAPLAERWARHHIDSTRPPRMRSDTPMCDAIVSVALAGIGEACIDDADRRLRALLATVIDDLEQLKQADTAPVSRGAGTRIPA